MDIQYYKDYAFYEKEHWWFKGRKKILASVLSQFNSTPTPTADVLDAGCGTGGSYELLSKFGRVIGIEANLEALKFNKGYHKIIASDINCIGLKSNLFDIVVALDVIEHIRDDQKAIKELHRVCKPNGIIMITAPAFSFLWGRQDVISHHQRRYAKKELEQLVEKCGLKILKISYFNSIFFPIILIIRLLMRMRTHRPTEIKSDFSMFPSALSNRICELIFSFESKLLPFVNLTFGCSIVCIGRKQSKI